MTIHPEVDVYTVLYGDKYDPEYAYRLQSMVARHMGSPYTFRVITNQQLPGITTIPQFECWPGWWQKVSVFRPGFATRTSLLLDLDIVIVKNLGDLIDRYRDTILAAPLDWSQGSIAAAFVLWNPCEETHAIYRKFSADVMKRLHGDQNWMTEVLGDDWTEIPPGEIVSYKWHCRAPRGTGEPPPNAKVICFHGLPDPHQCSERWIINEWRR